MHRRVPAIALAAALLPAACLMGGRVDATAVRAANETKLAALSLLVQAQDPPGEHEPEIADVQRRVADARSDAVHRLGDTTLADMWTKMADPDGRLLGGFISRWRVRGTGFSQDVLNAEGARIGAAFDAILDEVGGGE
jgi:hypothetical protein